jgi:hypothetical protein
MGKMGKMYKSVGARLMRENCSFEIRCRLLEGQKMALAGQ